MSDPAPRPKSKTKAKARYLKAKKERRKFRKAPGSLQVAHKPVFNVDSPSDSSEGSSSDGESASEEQRTVQLPAPAKASITEAEAAKSPKKRRKNKAGSDDGRMDIDQVPVLAQEEVAPLRSFPVPTQPEPPSKSVLARQGLDRSLANAEIIDPRTTLPLQQENDVTRRLSSRMRKRLGELGIAELFAIQTAILPFLLTNSSTGLDIYRTYDPPRDVLASAPTGSGKTLAYVVPIAEILASRIVTRLRALVVLPTRDLVQQVKETFEACCKGTKLKIATATGQHSFAHEQSQIVSDTATVLQGGSSKVDILICTPGRLIDHLNGTPNFTLQHLRFLVVDEADRLLTQSFQDWLKQILAAIQTPTSASLHIYEKALTTFVGDDDDQWLIPQHDALAPTHLIETTYNGNVFFTSDFDEPVHSSCQKLLFSATLTSNPSKIAELNLRDAKWFVVKGKAEERMDIAPLLDEGFELPPGLSEHMVVTSTSLKPLVLFHLIQQYRIRNAFVFTRSTESTVRLLRLFEYFFQATSGPLEVDQGWTVTTVKAEAFSSDLAPVQRAVVLERFKRQEVDVLICSDLISRGLDIPHVSHVINYDAPVDMRKYVHRVGRTARAGRDGDAWSLIEEQEARHFKAMLKSAGHLSKVQKVKVKEKDIEAMLPQYNHALSMLKESFGR